MHSPCIFVQVWSADTLFYWNSMNITSYKNSNPSWKIVLRYKNNQIGVCCLLCLFLYSLVSSGRSQILIQICKFQQQVCLSICDLLVDTWRSNRSCDNIYVISLAHLNRFSVVTLLIVTETMVFNFFSETSWKVNVNFPSVVSMKNIHSCR